jgi:hypothetical protein
MKWFAAQRTVEEVKRRYRTLAQQYHPDLGGNTRDMQDINNEYQAALKACDGQTSKGSDNKDHTYRYNCEVETAVMEKIQELLRWNFEGVTVALIGTWIWLTGDTKTHKDQIKALGLKYSGEKVAWYWHTGSYHRRSKHGASFGSMASRYGYQQFGDKDRERQDRVAA